MVRNSVHYVNCHMNKQHPVVQAGIVGRPAAATAAAAAAHLGFCHLLRCLVVLL
jgi:hypothetical protein